MIIQLLGIAHPIEGTLFQVQGVSRPGSRPVPIGGSEPISGTRDSGMGPFFFFFFFK